MPRLLISVLLALHLLTVGIMSRVCNSPTEPVFTPAIEGSLTVPVAPVQLRGVTYYVSPEGSDRDAGTSARPFRTIQKAADSVNPGDTVVVEDGIYTYTARSCTSRSVVCITRGGAADNWVVFKSRNKWGAKIDGRDNSVANGWSFQANAGYVRVEGFDVYGFGADGSAAGFEIYNGGENIQIAGNHIHDIGRLCTDTANGQVGIFIQQGNVTVERNLIHDIGRFIPGERGCNPSTSFFTNHDHGIYVNGNSPGAQNVTIRNNIFYSISRGWAVQIYPGVLKNTSILNNTFANSNPYKSGQVIIYSVSLSGARIENNIFYQPKDSAISLGGSSTLSEVAIRNNITTAQTIADATMGGLTLGNNRTGADPKLVNPSGFDFRLSRESPAIDAGLQSLDLLDDFEGRARPQGRGYDVGAYEFSSEHVQPTIKRAEVVGKRLYVYGENFDSGATVLVNDHVQKTSNQLDSSHELMCKKAGRKIQPGASVVLKARNPAGPDSTPFVFTASMD